MNKNTLVLFSSDNGPVWYDKDRERFGHDATGGLRGMKFASWEGGHRMPFLVRWAEGISESRTCDQTVVFSDLLATLAELVGLKQIRAGMAEDSVSFLPYLVDAKKKTSPRSPIIHDRRTIRDGDWKLILPKRPKRSNNKKAVAELYNLKEDRAEQNNQISEQPEIARKLKQKLDGWLRNSRD